MFLPPAGGLGCRARNLHSEQPLGDVLSPAEDGSHQEAEFLKVLLARKLEHGKNHFFVILPCQRQAGSHNIPTQLAVCVQSKLQLKRCPHRKQAMPGDSDNGK